jgi:hypothetical protein
MGMGDGAEGHWSLATDGVLQRMEFGNGWSLATDGVWQRMELIIIFTLSPQCPIPNAQSPIPNAQCPMPNPQSPITNSQCIKLITDRS